MSAIELNHLTRSYGRRRGVVDVTFEVAEEVLNHLWIKKHIVLLWPHLNGNLPYKVEMQ